jgi:hypothetical protein
MSCLGTFFRVLPVRVRRPNSTHERIQKPHVRAHYWRAVRIEIGSQMQWNALNSQGMEKYHGKNNRVCYSEK